MQQLKDRILADGRLLDGFILKVDNFLNHQLDVGLLDAIGEEFAKRFAGEKIDKILTIESSGIAVACAAARALDYPHVVFAKKTATLVQDPDAFEAPVYSYTKKISNQVRVSKRYLNAGENVLIIDDFLAHGQAACGLVDIVKQAGANPVGVGIVIEKGFQQGASEIAKTGVRLESLAVLESLENGIQLRD